MKIHIGKFFCIAGVIWLAGCAGLKMPAWHFPSLTAGAKTAQADKGPRSLKDIATNLKGETKFLWLNADGPFEYTTYMLSHPRRLAIEVPGMANALSVSSILLDDDLLARISVIEFKKAGSMRVEISLKHKVEYSLSLDGPILTVIFTPIDVERDSEALAGRLIMAQGRIKTLTMENYRLQGEVEDLKRRLATDNISKPDQENRGDVARNDNPPPRQAMADQKEPVRKAVTQWLTAWRGKDFEKYFGFYADTFMKTSSMKKAWIASKRKKFRKAGSISVEAKNMEIEANGDKAVVQFIQVYQSSLYRDKGHKTLTMVKTGEGWKIETETWRPQN